MDYKDIEAALALKKRRIGLLKLIVRTDYISVALTMPRSMPEDIGYLFSSIESSLREVARAELKVVEFDLKNLGVVLPEATSA